MITTIVTAIMAALVIAIVGIALPAMIIVTLEREWLDHKRRKAEWILIREAVAAHAKNNNNNDTPTT